jgi:hypothetical protein
MNPIIAALINLLETFVENNESAWVAELIAEIEKFLPKAKVKLSEKV